MSRTIGSATRTRANRIRPPRTIQATTAATLRNGDLGGRRAPGARDLDGGDARLLIRRDAPLELDPAEGVRGLGCKLRKVAPAASGADVPHRAGRPRSRLGSSDRLGARLSTLRRVDLNGWRTGGRRSRRWLA